MTSAENHLYYIEIPLTPSPTTFTLTRTDSNKFLLSENDSYMALSQAIFQWSNQNIKTTATQYQDFLQKRVKPISSENLNPKKLRTPLRDFLDITSERPGNKNPFLLSDSNFQIDLTPRENGVIGKGLSPEISEFEEGEKEYKTPRMCFGSITPIKGEGKEEGWVCGVTPNSRENERKGLGSMLEELTLANSEPIYGGCLIEKTRDKRYDAFT
jgi:hypothetical protein